MSNNTNLTRELAVKLIRSQEVVCPKCNKSVLISRYRHKHQNTEYKCPTCGEIYHPCKLIKSGILKKINGFYLRE